MSDKVYAAMTRCMVRWFMHMRQGDYVMAERWLQARLRLKTVWIDMP